MFLLREKRYTQQAACDLYGRPIHTASHMIMAHHQMSHVRFASKMRKFLIGPFELSFEIDHI